MEAAIDIVSWLFIGFGSLFSLTAGIGILRLPDFYTRMHAVGIGDTLGVGLITVGLMFQAGWTMPTIKLILILVFLLFTSPTASYALANAAVNAGLKPKLHDEGDAS